MEYLLLIYGNEGAMLSVPKEASSQMLSAYMAYSEAIPKTGLLPTVASLFLFRSVGACEVVHLSPPRTFSHAFCIASLYAM